jgi:hypothetical protein
VETGQHALILFYAFFWAAALGVTGRYEPFDTPSMSAGNGQAWRRFVVSLVILNLLPIGWFIFLYSCVVSKKGGILCITAAAIASLTVFGFHRILHACIASEPLYGSFYTPEQIKKVRCRGPFAQPQTFKAHFIPGLLYLAFWGGVAWIISCAVK